MIIKNLRYIREILDIKQKDIAKIFNLSFTTISGWETGKDTIPLKRLIKYANHFNYSLDYLFGITKNNIEYEPLDINLENIAKNLRILRKNGMTQKEIAKKLGISRSYVSRIEKRAITKILREFIKNKNYSE